MKVSTSGTRRPEEGNSEVRIQNDPNVVSGYYTLKSANWEEVRFFRVRRGRTDRSRDSGTQGLRDSGTFTGSIDLVIG